MPGKTRASLPRLNNNLRWRPASQRGEQGGLEKLRKSSKGVLRTIFVIFGTINDFQFRAW